MSENEDTRLDLEVCRFFLIAISGFAIVLALRLCGPQWTIVTLIATAIPSGIITFLRVRKLEL